MDVPLANICKSKISSKYFRFSSLEPTTLKNACGGIWTSSFKMSEPPKKFLF
ncbi:MAG: hypothetical protein ABWJ98_01965 [Hydrogenothermaceae bacterium]